MNTPQERIKLYDDQGGAYLGTAEIPLGFTLIRWNGDLFIKIEGNFCYCGEPYEFSGALEYEV